MKLSTGTKIRVTNAITNNFRIGTIRERILYSYTDNIWMYRVDFRGGQTPTMTLFTHQFEVI